MKIIQDNRHAIIASLGIVCFSIVVAFLPCKAQCATGVGSGHIEVLDLDAKSAKLLFVFDEEMGSDDFRERSTSWLVIEQFGAVTEVPIGRADPDWKLVGTNNITIWHWKLEKTFHLQYQTNGIPGIVFPCEVFTVTFYVATNLSRWFSSSIDVPNFSVSVETQYVDYNQSSWTFQPEGCPYFLRVDLHVFHAFEYKVIALMLFILLFIVIAAAFFLIKKRREIGSSDLFRVSSSLLVFLPVFFFTFRNSMAPKYLTTFDGLCFFGAIIYGSVLLWKLVCLDQEKNSETATGVGKEKTATKDKEQPSEEKRDRYEKIKSYYLTYLECCYGAFITIFIGILAIPILPISNIILKVATVCGFWFVGGYYLAQIIYTYGQLKVVFGYLEIDEVISKDVEKLGFPFKLLERVFKYARKPIYGRANIKYFVIGLGYLGFLGISIIACLNL